MRTATSPPSRVLAFVDSTYWAIYLPAYVSMRAVIESWAAMPYAPARLSATERAAAIEAAQAARPTTTYTAPSTIAVMSMFGVISPRSGMVDDMSQEGCCLDSWCARYKAAMLDTNIAGVIVNCDSPGGNIYGVEECADMVYEMRDMKPNVGVVTGMSASACFWIASQFRELVASPSSEVGSIGVVMRHEDVSKMMEEMGVTETYIEAPQGGYKSEGNPFTPISEDTIQYLTGRCEEYYQAFISQLARGRGTKAKVIDQEWGRGRMFSAKSALSLGMVDRISTLQGEIDRMAQRLTKKGGGMRAGDMATLPTFAAEVSEEKPPEEKTAETVESAAPSVVNEEAARSRAIRRLRLA